MSIGSGEVHEGPISSRLQENVEYVDKLIGIGTSWDVIRKPFAFGGVQMMAYVTNGFFITIHVIVLLQNLETTVEKYFQDHDHDHAFSVEQFMQHLNTHVPFVQVQPVDTMSDAIRFVLSGPLVIFVDGCTKALLVDTRVYPTRSITESEVERVVRGPRDAFTETMLMNIALIRRRLRDAQLRTELIQIGTRSQTDVTLLYLQDVTNAELVTEMRQRLHEISVDSIPMAEQSIAELIGRMKWNPYPIVRYTERPDVAVTALIEGQVVIVVDTSPEVIIAPTSFFQHLQHPQEFHSNPMIGSYMRWVILFAALFSVVLPGVFLLLNSYPHWIPRELAFFRADAADPLPLWAELLIAEVSLDILRLAVLNTPVTLSSSVSIIAALLFGQFAAKIHLMQPEVLVYMGFVIIAQLSTSSYELGNANQMARFWIILWTAPGGLGGFAIALLSWFLLLALTNSFGVPYLWPVLPFQWKSGLLEVLLRRPTEKVTGRPPIFRPKTYRRRG